VVDVQQRALRPLEQHRRAVGERAVHAQPHVLRQGEETRRQAVQKVQQTAAALQGIDPTSELSRMEEKIRMEEARARATSELNESSLDRRFAELEADPDVESELAALKAASAPAALPAGKSGEEKA